MVRLIDFDRARQEVGEREVERERREVKRVFGRSVRKRS